MVHIIDQVIRLLIALLNDDSITRIAFDGKMCLVGVCWVHRRRETNAVCEMKGEESKTIFSINGADSFRRRAAYALAAGTALGLYLSLSFSLSSRISDSHSVLLRDSSFLFLPRENICFCLLATKGSEFHADLVGWIIRSAQAQRDALHTASSSVQVIIEPSIKIANLRVLFYLYLLTWHSVS